jgi:hypothetical protein
MLSQRENRVKDETKIPDRRGEVYIGKSEAK